MALTDYASYNSIRAAVGVSEPEIPDTVLALSMYDVMLREDLRELDEDLAAAYLALTPRPPTVAAQLRFYELVQSYSAMQVGLQLVNALPLFAPRLVEDSSTKWERMADPYKGLREGLSGSLAYVRTRLLDAYATASSTTAAVATTRTLVANVGLGTNPITGV